MSVLTHHLPKSEEELPQSDCGVEKLRILADNYGVAKKIHLNGIESVSAPNVHADRGDRVRMETVS